MDYWETALDWSVVGVGICLLGLSLAIGATVPENDVAVAVRLLLPVAISLSTIAFGHRIRRRAPSKRDVGVVAAGAIAGGVLFFLMDFWVLFLISVDGRVAPSAASISINKVSFGVLGTAMLAWLYVSLQKRNAELQQLTRRLEERNERLNEQTAKLEAQNQRLNQFAQIVSHDLRNPLNVAAGRLQLARETGDPEQFETIERSLDRMETIITDTLALANQGQTVEVTQSLSLGALAEAAWETVETGDVALNVESDVRLEADENRLRQALENLFRNAIDHGGSELTTVRVGSLSDGFYVEDDGTGIDPGDREQIFEIGFSTQERGSGLGMVIVEAIVQAHGWSIEVTEASDGGARFEIRTESVDSDV